MGPSPAAERFRPFLRLEASADATLRVGGILETFAAFGRDGPWIRFERMHPPRFRLSFVLVSGLEGHAVRRAAELKPALRSPNWKRLVELTRDYSRLDARDRIVLLKLLGMLSLYWDIEDLEGAAGEDAGGSWNETEAELAFLKAFNVHMLFEPSIKDGFAAMLRIAERAPEAGLVRFLAAMRFLTANLERGCADERVRGAERLILRSLAGLKKTLPPAQAAVYESKYWRAAGYFPFLREDYAEARRRLASSERAARKALAAAEGDERAFALENLYSVLATRVVTDLRTKRFAQACAWARELAVLDSRGSWHRLSLGMALTESRRFDEARAELEECLRLAPPGREEARKWLVRCLEGLGDAAGAARCAEEGRAEKAVLDSALRNPSGNEAKI